MNQLWICLFLGGVLSAHGQVNYENVLPKGLTPETKKYRMLWLERTKGENLAKGVKVLFSLAPDWTHDEKNDPWKLTDGKLSTQNDDRIYFDHPAMVGWHNSLASMGVNWLLDLGAAEPAQASGRSLSQRHVVQPPVSRIVALFSQWNPDHAFAELGGHGPCLPGGSRGMAGRRIPQSSFASRTWVS